MTTLLALDATSEACSVALIVDGALSQRFSATAREHTQRLLPMVDELLSEAGISVNQLDAIAFGRGPGSFTGLRICMGVVQGLAFGGDLPVIPVSSLQAMAMGYIRNNPIEVKTKVLTALDARMNEIYWCEYSVQSGLPIACREESVDSPDVVAKQLLVTDQPCMRIGVGAGWHYPAMSTVPTLFTDFPAVPNAEDILVLAEPLWHRDEVMDIFEVEPVYLRNSVAWQKRNRIRGAV